MNETNIIIINALIYFKRFLEVLIIIRVLLSWVRISRDNIAVRFVYNMTEPILGPIRNLIYKSPIGGPGSMLDFSPIIACIAIDMVMNFLISIIARF